MLLDVNVSATKRLGLEPVKDPANKGEYLFGGITPAIVTEVSVIYEKHEKGEFVGLDVPVLAIEFQNLKLEGDEPDKFLTWKHKPVGSKEKTEESTDENPIYRPREVAKIDGNNLDMWKAIKHFLDSLTASPNYRNIAAISKTDIAKYLDLPAIAEPEERLEKYNNFFTYIANFINGTKDDKSDSQIVVTTKNEKGDIIKQEPLPLWVKVTPNYSGEAKFKETYYEIGRFINQGVFEPLRLVKGRPIDPKILKFKGGEKIALRSGANANPAQTGQAGNAAATNNVVNQVKDMLNL